MHADKLSNVLGCRELFAGNHGMNRPFHTLAILLIGISLSACAADKKNATLTTSTTTSTTLTTSEQKAAYSMGYVLGKRNAEVLGQDFSTEAFSQGMRDAFGNKPAALSEEDMKKAVQEYQAKREKAMEALQAQQSSKELAQNTQVSQENEAKGQAFLAANAKKPGIKTTASGLQYEVIQAGNGPRPKASDSVKVHYEGKLIDGTVFDSSIARGEPITFPLNGVIPGWTEGVQLMPVGSKYRFYIPSKLAYGETGAGTIPPNSTLIFDVELLGIEK